MNAFLDTFTSLLGYVAAICCGIIILAVFFSCLNGFKNAILGFKIFKSKGFIKEGKLVNIHLRNNKSISGIFLGFMEQELNRNGIPRQMSGMLVLDSVNGKRIFIKTANIDVIEEVGDSVVH